MMSEMCHHHYSHFSVYHHPPPPLRSASNLEWNHSLDQSPGRWCGDDSCYGSCGESSSLLKRVECGGDDAGREKSCPPRVVPSESRLMSENNPSDDIPYFLFTFWLWVGSKSDTKRYSMVVPVAELVSSSSLLLVVVAVVVSSTLVVGSLSRLWKIEKPYYEPDPSDHSSVETWQENDSTWNSSR